MAVLNPKKTYKFLQKKGFEKASGKSNDHKWLEFWVEGKLTKIKTKISHGSGDINSSLISLMSKQTYLTPTQFRQLAECTISQKEYIAILKKNKVL